MSTTTIDQFLDELQALDVRVWFDDGQIRCSAPKGVLTAEMREQLRIRKDELRAALQPDGSARAAARPRDDGDVIPLSPAQERVWFFQQLEPESSTYNLSVVVTLRGPLDERILRESLGDIVRRQDVLRTRFTQIDGEPRQVIDSTAQLQLDVENLSATSAAARDSAAEQIWKREAAGAFHLDTDLPIRVVLIRLGENEHQLVVTMHHVVADGTSMVLFLRELVEHYAARSRGGTPAVLDLPIQYGAYAKSQRRWLASPDGRQALNYWVDRFSGELPTLELPADRIRPAVQTFRGASQNLTLSSDTSALLRALSRRHGSTLFMTMLAALNAVLFRFGGDEDIVVGAPTAGRDDERVSGLLGMFVNTLALRTDLSGNPTFDDLLIRVRDVCLKGFANQDLPFARLLEALRLPPDLSRTPLFQVMLNMFTLEVEEEVRVGELTFTAPPVDRLAAAHDSQSKFDLTVYARDHADGIRLSLVYNADLFSDARMEVFARCFRQLLDSVAQNPQRRIGDIPFDVADAESDRPVLHAMRPAPFEPLPVEFVDESITARFAEVAARQADRIAISTSAEQMSYGALDAFATSVAERLNGVLENTATHVGLLCDHDASMIGAILGVLKQGSAYVPLDPAFPEDRLGLLLDDARVTTLLVAPAHVELAERLAKDTRRIVRIDADGPRIPIATGPRPDTTAYILYTSGSSGRPKGIWQNHRNVLHYIRGYVNTLEVTAADRLTLVASYTFDASIVDIFTALISGATLYPVQLRVAGLLGIAKLLRDERITIYHSTPTLYRALAPHVDQDTASSIRAVVLGGEKVHAQDVLAFRERFDGRALFVNLYGASEVTIASMELISGSGRVPIGGVSIGAPVENTELLLIDADGRPASVRGEIAVTSRHLALGYWNAPELTERAFSNAPEQGGRRIYRTGDLARRGPDGALEFLGRKDAQIKIRGMRVEPGEIETVLANHPRVAQCAVTVDRSGKGDPVLLAFVVIAPTGSATTPELKSSLARAIPDYMMPAAIVALDALPLTRTGKIDRRALPSSRELGLDRAEYVGPRNPTEQLLVEIWQEVLQIDSLGVRDNFFSLGGNSLNATQVIARLRVVAEIDLPLRALFTAPTIEGLAAVIQSATASDAVSGPVLTKRGLLDAPLSYAQERMWFLQQFIPDGAAYNMVAAIGLRGPLDRGAFFDSVKDVVQRHEILRSVFRVAGADPSQQVVSLDPLPVVERDVSHLAPADRRAEAERIATELALRPFALDAAPPWWILMIRLDENEYACVFGVHHILGDLWSFGVLGAELARLYNARVGGKPVALPPLDVQYSDYSVWQREWLEGPRLDAQLAYWKPRLSGLSPLELPTDRPRPPIQTANGDRIGVELPEGLGDRIRAFSIREGVTPFMTMFAAFNVLLHRYSGQTDIAVGVPIANRTQVGVEGLIGTFVNTLVHRNDLSDNPSFHDLLQRVRSVALDAYAHQDLPFERLVRDLSPERDASRTPVFQVLFNMANAPHRVVEFDGLTTEPFEVSRRAAQFDLTVNARIGEQSWIMATFNTDLFDRATAERLLRNYATLLDAVTRAPRLAIGRIAIMSDDDRRSLLDERNDTVAPYPNQAVTALVSAQATRTPAAVAVEFGSVAITYAQLEERSNQLARYLRRRGVTDGALVGVCLNRSAEMVVALLGVLKAGAAYVPIDPTYPEHRVQFMLDDSGASTIVTESALLRRLPETSAAVVALDRDATEIAGETGSPLESSPSLDSRAYVIYTSGSTGNPKGVQLSHGALVNFLWSMRETPGLTAADSLLAVTTISFDIAGLELYLPLVCGATIVLASTEVAADGRRLRELIERRRPTVMQATPATWRGLIDAGWQGDSASLRVLCGGEALPRELADALLSRAKEVWNLYGPTETTIWSTVHRVTTGSDAVPIGRPIANTRVYVLDQQGEVVPVGVHGELFIGGAGVALGYLNRPELTEARFVADPFVGDGSRMYRTGDRVKFRPDGTLEHLGRLDNQVKVRGYRIELGEIEAALDRLPATNQSVVEVRQDRLVAYVVFEPNQQMTASEIRAELRDTLPDYMVPSLIVPLDRLPLTPNGKVDRKALPDPLRAGGRRDAQFQPPTTPTEVAIATVWKEMLGVEQVGTGDNFFELGGHSLLSIRAVHEIHQRTGWRPDPRLFFFETLRKIAAAKPDSAVP